jgi:hypothetical protein
MKIKDKILDFLFEDKCYRIYSIKYHINFISESNQAVLTSVNNQIFLKKPVYVFLDSRFDTIDWFIAFKLINKIDPEIKSQIREDCAKELKYARKNKGIIQTKDGARYKGNHIIGAVFEIVDAQYGKISYTGYKEVTKND